MIFVMIMMLLLLLLLFQAEMCIETDEDAAVSVCKMMPEPR
jgi:hypothetical protein